MLNKPVGCVSACRDEVHRTVLDFLPEELREGLFPVGRLDKNSEGLLLLTNDGKWNRFLLEPENHVEKRYLFWAAGTLPEEQIAEMERGLRVKGIVEPLRPVRLELLKRGTLREVEAPFFDNRRHLLNESPDAPAFYAGITLTEGKRHQIKRMLEAVGCTVVSLKRVSFGGLLLDEDLRPGEYRPLTEEELLSIAK